MIHTQSYMDVYMTHIRAYKSVDILTYGQMYIHVLIYRITSVQGSVAQLAERQPATVVSWVLSLPAAP